MIDRYIPNYACINGHGFMRTEETDDIELCDVCGEPLTQEPEMQAMIDLETARQIAYAWHGGGGSPLYSFASTSNDGEARNITPATVAEVNECLPIANDPEGDPSLDGSDLRQLRDYLTAHLPAKEDETED